MKYTMTQDEFDALKKAASIPGVFTGGILAGYNPARAASEKLWQKMGEKYGFDWNTVRAVSAGSGTQMEFTAEPKPRLPQRGSDA